jgi:Amt family ammonium transporter
LNLPGIVLAFLLPVGVMMAAWGGLSPEQSRRAASVSLLALALSIIAYTAAGFAFQFGGIWHVTQLEAFRSLDQFWGLPDPTGNTWSVIGLSGWMLTGDLGPEALVLFLHQLPLVIAAAMIPMLALGGRAHNLVLACVGLMAALVISPLAGHWVWGGGWLAALGANLRLGHGYVDAGGAGAVYLASGLLALLGLVTFPGPKSPSNESPRLPQAHLPLLAVAGGVFFGLGWMAWMATDPFHPAGAALNLSLAITNGLLSAAAATIASQLFSWFTSSRVEPLMAVRGWMAGWVAASAMAPFVGAGSALVVGALTGLLVPLVMYAMERLLRLDDATAAVSIYGAPGLLGALVVGIVASGRWGAGWNGVGAEEYLLVAGQGVTGLLPASGFSADSGQLTAQLAGAGALMLWTIFAGGLVMVITHLAVSAWPRKTSKVEARISNGE